MTMVFTRKKLRPSHSQAFHIQVEPHQVGQDEGVEEEEEEEEEEDGRFPLIFQQYPASVNCAVDGCQRLAKLLRTLCRGWTI